MALLIIDNTAGTGTAVGNNVTINALAGTITTEALTTAAAGSVDITLTNSLIAAGDLVLCNVYRATSGGDPVLASVHPAGGSCAIRIYNIHASAAFNGALVINFLVVKATH